MNLNQTMLLFAISLAVMALPGPPFYDKASQKAHKVASLRTVISGAIAIICLIRIFIFLGG